MKALTGVFLAGSILFLIGSGCGESTTENTSSASTSKERVRDALGDEVQVQAGGYAGDLKINDVSFAGAEAQVTAKTPEGGSEGPSCGDLDDGAQAVFTTIYYEGGWNGGAVLVYKGGLVDRSTGKELPEANTGMYTMPAGQAEQIDWTDEDALSNIDWSIYRDFCHQALK